MLRKPRQRFNWWKLASYACAGIIGGLLGQSTWRSKESEKLLTRASNEVVLLTQSLKALRASQAGWVELGKLGTTATNGTKLITNEIALFEVVTNTVVQLPGGPLTNYFELFEPHKHGYTAGWSEPQQAEDNYIIPQFYQWRKCAECGEVEFRKCLRSRDGKSRL